MNVDHIENESALLREVRRRSLRQEQGRAHVAAHEFIPPGPGDLAHRRRVERRGIVDEDVDPAEMPERRRDQLVRRLLVLQVRGEKCGGSRARGVQFRAELFRGCARGSVVHQNARTCRVERPRDLGTDAACGAGDQDHLVVERVPGAVRHARSRYRIAHAGCIGARSALG
jgi:hypothetical protein